MSDKLSAVVISYNRAALIGTCLRALGFADEVILVDKSSTDATRQVAARHADRIITVPWTPTVEDTRAFAIDQCSGDWILCLDDDECLSPESGDVLRAELAAPRGDIYYLPLRHYILGVHDEAAYYWPEHHPRLFRRGAVAFTATVHGGMRLCSDRTVHLPPDSGVAIHHLSHRDVSEWIDKTNRYTSRTDRRRPEHAGHGLVAFAHERLDHWQTCGPSAVPGGYPAAVAVLRAVYDVVDRLKTWEEERGLDGAAEFVRVCHQLDSAYAALPARAGRVATSSDSVPLLPAPQPDAVAAALRGRIAEIRTGYDAMATAAARWEREAQRLDADLGTTSAQRNQAQQALAAEQERNVALAETAAALRHQAEAAERQAAAAGTRAEAACREAAAAQREAEAAHREAGMARLQAAAMQDHAVQTRAHADAMRAQAETIGLQAEAMRIQTATLRAAAEERAEAAGREAETLRRRLVAIETSTCWRATAAPRRFGAAIKRLLRRRSQRIGSVVYEWSE